MKARAIIFAAIVLLGSFSLPAAACRPFGSYEFAEDKEGGIWFTEGDNNAISRLAPDGTVTAHKLPTPHSEPSSVVLDRKGNVWYVAMDAARIGRLGKDGRIVEFPTTNGHPGKVEVDRRGEAWFTQMSGHESGGEHAVHGSHDIAKIGRIDRRGVMHDYPLAEGWPTSIVFDNRDRAWVGILVPGTKETPTKGRLARIGREGKWTVVKAWDDNSCPGRLVADSTGRVYFADGCRKVVGYLAADGKLTEWKLPEGMQIQHMSLGNDGRLWFTDRQHIGHIDRNGNVHIAPRGDNGDSTMAVLATRKGDVVFSEFYNYNINRLTKNGEYVEHLVNVDERKGVREVKEGEVCYVKFAARIAAKAEMDKKRAEEVRNGHFKPDGMGTEKLVEQKCLVCHDTRRLLLSRRSDWSPSVNRMHAYRDIRQVEPLTAEETARLVQYFNTYYSINQ